VSLPLAILLSILFVILLIALPYGMYHYNWFNMRDVVYLE
jgi:hypothetical protein